MIKFFVALLLPLLAAGCGGSGAFAGWEQQEIPPKPLAVGTWNVYYGADLGDAVMAVIMGDPDAMVAATTQAFAQVAATDFTRRARVIADEIVAHDLDLVGLQEAVLWRTQSPADSFGPEPTPAEDVVFDFLQILLEELATRGAVYEVAALLETFDAELPGIDSGGELQDVRITDREAILVRRRDDGTGVQVIGSDGALFGVYLELPGGIATPQGWVSVDGIHEGHPFRFVSTHLEADIVDIRMAQAAELLAGPAFYAGPTVLVGDFNTDALHAGDGSAPCYDLLLAGGFTDAATGWVGVDDTGTATRAASLDDPLDELTARLDLVLLGPDAGLVVEEAALMGAAPEGFVDGLWPSDHAGVAVFLAFEDR